MASIQDRHGILYAGAWLNYGFHEDGFTAGLRAAMAVGGRISPPFDIQEADREPRLVLIASVFDFMEWTGIRKVGGNVLGYVLDVLAATASSLTESRNVINH